MATTEAPARQQTLPMPLRVAIAPLTLLERTRGRKRSLLIVAYVVAIGAAGALTWRATSLKGLPNVGDPFDVRKASHVDVLDSDNAFVLYRQAVEKIQPASRDLNKIFTSDWSKATPDLRRCLRDNQAALELFRQGSNRPKALYHQPGSIRFDTSLEVAQQLRILCRLALLEGSRRETEGDMEGAWIWYRAALRGSRLVSSHGPMIQGLIGAALVAQSSQPVMNWASNPRVNAATLRRALADVKACKAMSTPVSEMIQGEYLALMKEMERPQKLLLQAFEDDTVWYHHHPGWTRAEIFWTREPERSRRVARLVFRNWLTFADEPASRRPAVSKNEPRVFNRPTAGLTPDAVERWFESATLARLFLPALSHAFTAMDRDRRVMGSLEVALAEQLYRREHGTYPRSLGQLVGRFLDRLPEGYAADDGAITAPAPTEARATP
jgi:hypothetical protein